MEISVIGSSQVKLGRGCDAGLFNFGKNLSANICDLKNNNSKAWCLVQNQSMKWPSKASVGFTLRASAAAQTPDTVNFENAPKTSTAKPVDGVKLFVGLPLDTVSNSNKINRARAIAAGLKALKLLGVDGVELPVWWGIGEKEAMGKYDWTGYLAVVEMVGKLGLELHVSVCFHASEECRIRLPEWVRQIGEGDSGLYFADRSGQQYKDCLSLAVDDVPVLDGKTPVEVYREFCESFKCAFWPFMGSTITSEAARGIKCRSSMGPHDQSPLSHGFFAQEGGSSIRPCLPLLVFNSAHISRPPHHISQPGSTTRPVGMVMLEM